MRYLVAVVCLLIASAAVAQNTQTRPASLRTAFTQPLPAPKAPAWVAEQADSSYNNPCGVACCAGCFANNDYKYNLFFDSRRTFLSGEPVRMNGIRAGVEVFDKMRFGVGFYGLSEPLDITDRVEDSGPRTRKLSFNYVTTYMEYIAYRDFRWELDLPFQLGRGSGRVDSLNTALDKRGLEREDPVTILTLGASGHVRIIPWLGLGAGTGYVWASSENRTATRAFSAPYYNVRVRLWLGYLFKALFAPDKLEAERAEYKKERDARRSRGGSL